ncbi:MAG: hypothetical protein U0Z26_02595 [Anaerolineales bacterium]
MSKTPMFLKGFLLGSFLVLCANGLAAQLLSDCGLPAVLGISHCSDDIVRVGFPFIFLKQGGYIGQNILNPQILLLDLLIGLGIALLIGFVMHRRAKIK